VGETFVIRKTFLEKTKSSQTFFSLSLSKKEKKVSTKKVEIEQKGEVWIDAEKFAHVKA
jgi:hypothetical protein